MTIAATIRNQIKSIDPWALGAWGAKDLVDMGNGFKFKTSGMTGWKGYVYIRYNAGKDLYDIDFFRLRNYAAVYDKKIEGVFCDQLVSIIDDFVG